MTKDMVTKILKSLMSESNRKFSDSEKVMKVKTWMMALDDISDEQGKHGFEKAIKLPNEFMISAGKFRELCTTENGQNSIEDQANEAWALVMSGLDHTSSPVFKDASIAEAIRKMGGWGALCLMLVDEEPFKKKDFTSIYSIVKRRDQEYNPMLKGKYKGSYKFLGFDENDDLEKVMLDVETKSRSDEKMILMLQGKR